MIDDHLAGEPLDERAGDRRGDRGDEVDPVRRQPRAQHRGRDHPPFKAAHPGVTQHQLAVGHHVRPADLEAARGVDVVFGLAQQHRRDHVGHHPLHIGVQLGLLLARVIARGQPDRQALIGQAGEARTRIKDSGSVQVGGELWSARSEKPIEQGKAVRVVQKDGFVLVVEEFSK